MPDWQERITRETAPAIRAEHDLRYRLVAPLVADSAVWADLGCGTGLAAAAALAGQRPSHAILVDLETDVVAGAAAELGVDGARQIAGDLTDPAILSEVGEALASRPGPRVVSCFEVVEHLSTFVPLVEWSTGLAREGAATFVISVPNDAFWSIENPYHAGAWSQGAFEELRRLLPAEQTLLRQVALTGSALVGWQDESQHHELAVELDGASAVATHFIAAYGPRHAELCPAAVATQTDQLAQRRWERQRESDLALTQAIADHQRAEIEKLVEQNSQFGAWRTYIHELERELGRPPSGSDESPA